MQPHSARTGLAVMGGDAKLPSHLARPLALRLAVENQTGRGAVGEQTAIRIG